LWQPPQGAAFFLRDAFINSVFLGYDGPSPFPGSWLDSASQAYISPLWTLSIELYGSLIVLGLSLARKQSNRTWWLAVAIVFVVAFRTHYMCFVLGHALALRPPKPGGRILPLVLIVGGALVCAYAERGTIAPLVWACALDLPSMQCTSHPQKVIGAGLLFVGVLWSLDAHRFLSARPLAVLGKLSFPLYLVHWPFVLGLGSLALVSMVSLIGVDGARVVATLVAAGASLFAAACFVRVDSYAVSVGRCVRDWRWAVRPKF